MDTGTGILLAVGVVVGGVLLYSAVSPSTTTTQSTGSGSTSTTTTAQDVGDIFGRLLEGAIRGVGANSRASAEASQRSGGPGGNPGGTPGGSGAWRVGGTDGWGTSSPVSFDWSRLTRGDA